MGTLDQLEAFLRRGQAAQAAVDQELGKFAEHQVVKGKWIHLGCGGELVHTGWAIPCRCTTCAREVF